MNCVTRIRPATAVFQRTIKPSPFTATFRRFASNGPRVELQHLGLSVDLYVHPSPQNLPSWFSHPLMRLRGVGRRLTQLFQNTVMIGQFRMKSKIKPRFVEWKNLAIQTYVETNRAFASDKLDTIKDKTSIWVYESLKSRRAGMPKGTKLDWKLLKFNSAPKVMCLQPMMLPNSPLTHLMVVYRMDTQQRLVKFSPGDKEATKSERRVVDYIGFVYDTSKTPAEVVLGGSLFETPLNAPRPNPMAADQSERVMLMSMKEKGDIFRNPPPPLAIKN